jgi:hypothetical protein
MPKLSFRFFIIPLGAVCTLASLSSQHIAPQAQRGLRSIPVVHEQVQVVDCGSTNSSEVCVIR